MHTHTASFFVPNVSISLFTPLWPLTPDLDPNDPLPRTHAPFGHTLKSQYLKVCPAVPSSLLDISPPLPSLPIVTFYLEPSPMLTFSICSPLPCQDLPLNPSVPSLKQHSEPCKPSPTRSTLFPIRCTASRTNPKQPDVCVCVDDNVTNDSVLIFALLMPWHVPCTLRSLHGAVPLRKRRRRFLLLLLLDFLQL